MKAKSTIFYSLGGLLLAGGIIAAIKGITLIDYLPYVPIEEWSSNLIDWLHLNLESFFDAISLIITSVLEPLQSALAFLPPVVIIILLVALGWRLGNWKLGVFILLSLLLVSSMGYWEQTMTTLSLVLVATFLALVVGIPAGILKAHSRTVQMVLDPILDFMQTMPLFVYLIPAVLFFSIGNVPGIVATFIFATPPAVRLTSLGIEQISPEIAEAGRAFGASKWQFLTKVELPLAMPSIMAGVNQTIMLSLSMVVVASMIGG